MRFVSSLLTVMYCENQMVIYIAQKILYHEMTKNIEVDCHFIGDMVLAKRIGH